MLLQQIDISNLLSFGDKELRLELKPLNVLIGPNGSGKSNLIEAISLFQAAPHELVKPIREGGGISEWIWKGDSNGHSVIGLVINSHFHEKPLTHHIELKNLNLQSKISSEFINIGHRSDSLLQAYIEPPEGFDYLFYMASRDIEKCVISINSDGESRKIALENFDTERSILAQRKDPDQYPEITFLGKQYSKIKIYRDGCFPRDKSPRVPQLADLKNDFLSEDCKNLALVMNRLQNNTETKKVILKHLKDLFTEITDFGVNEISETFQIYLQEGDYKIPATRLSDGTLRYLCLLAILCHPKPPPLICIEEPEIGLHPDMISSLRDLLVAASERTQLIVTTHSDILISALTEYPETVVVCEKEKGQTVMKRLDKEEMKVWLEKYSLGELWLDGQIGGNRW